MNFIEFKLSKNLKLFSLMLLGLINFNFSGLYSLNIFGGGNKKEKDAQVHAADSVDSRTDSAGGTSGAGGSGGWFKSHSDSDLHTLLTRTAAKVGILETGQKELSVALREETSVRAAALTRLDGRMDEVVAATGRVDARLAAGERATAELRVQVCALDHKLILEERRRELENKETIRDGLKIVVPAVVDGAPANKYIRLSPASKDAYDLHLYSLTTSYDTALERARGPQQDNRHADDKKFLEGTVLESAAEVTRELSVKARAEVTWPRVLAVGAATGLAVWLTKRHK